MTARHGATGVGASEFRVFHPEDLGLRLTNWHYEPLDKSVLDRLRVGDMVRLVLGEEGSGWEKIYFEITKVDYYAKGGVTRPRKFHGKAMDTYRMVPRRASMIDVW